MQPFNICGRFSSGQLCVLPIQAHWEALELAGLIVIKSCLGTTHCLFFFFNSLIYFFEILFAYSIILVSGILHSDSKFLQMNSILSYNEAFAIFPVLYETSLQLICFLQSNLYLMSYPHLALPHFALPTGDSQFVLYIYEPVSVSLHSFICLIFFFFFQIPHISNNIQHFCLMYFTKHNTLQVHPCCYKWQNFILICG